MSAREKGQELAPLNEQEVEMVKRLFSDPFSIPEEFKAWLVAYLESNPPLLTASSVFGFRSAVTAIVAGATPVQVEIGTIVQFAGSTEPSSHWMICDNRLIDRTAYAVLYGRIGFQYSPTPGTDPGSNQFYIPDGIGRTLVGTNTADPAVSSRGKSDGLAAAVRRWLHGHDMSHGHSASSSASDSLIGPVAGGGTDYAARSGSVTVATTVNGFSGNTGAAGSPQLAVNHMIYVI